MIIDIIDTLIELIGLALKIFFKIIQEMNNASRVYLRKGFERASKGGM